MDDSFYKPATDKPSLPVGLWGTILSAPPALLITVLLLLAPVLLVVISRVLGGKAGEDDYGDEKTGGLLSYWFPKVGRRVSMLRGSRGSLRSQGSALFALDHGEISRHEVSGSVSVKGDPLEQSNPKFDSFAWDMASKFFGLSAKPKYDKVLKDLLTTQDQHLKELTCTTIHNLELNIPQMITYIDNSIDLQPWEKPCSSFYISDTTISIDLFSLLQNMLGHACIPAIFGRGLLDKYPSLIQELQGMDEGMEFFLLGLPAVMPWKGVFMAHMNRRRVWEAMDGLQKVLDGLANDREDYEWGDLSDVSSLVLEWNKLWRENGFKIKERGDICLLYALLTPTHILYNFTLHIITTPALLTSILAELKPHITIEPGLKIGKHSSPPSLKVSSEGLQGKCPLLRSTYVEVLGDGKMGMGGNEREKAGFVEAVCLAFVAGVLMMWEFEVEGVQVGETGADGWIQRTKADEGVRVKIMKRKIEWDE